MMPPDLAALLARLSTWVLPLLIAVPLHEAAHGYAAHLLGDQTAWRLGRVSFNPLKHIDPFGTVVLPLILFFGGGFLFGYAKPVPVNFRALRHPRSGMVLVAAAGPVMNLALACAAALLAHVSGRLPPFFDRWVALTLVNAVELNVVLAVFNLLPLPPLDGGRIAIGLLPRPLAMRLARVEPHGMLILIALIFLLPLLSESFGLDLNVIGWLLGPPVNAIIDFVFRVTGNA